MGWNIAAECISMIILCIIWTYSKKCQLLSSLKNKVFYLCMNVTFVAMVSNILSTVCINNLTSIPIWFTGFVTTIYFISTPLMGYLYFNYVVAVVYEQGENIFKIMALTSVPAVIYVFCVLLNSFNQCIFAISLAEGYVRGPLIILTYVVFYYYCISSLILVIWKGGEIEKGKRRILLVFPLLAFLVIVIQQIFVNITLSGSAATCAILILYLYLQNKQISIDYLTGLFNRLEFSAMIEFQLYRHKDTPFSVIVLSLRNFKQINSQFGQKYGDSLLLEISHYLRALNKACNIYRFGGDEFAIFLEGADKEELGIIVRALQKRMTQPWQIKEISKIVPAVIGIIQYPIEGNYTTGIIEGVEYAVATAKRDSTKNVCICTAKMLEEIKRREQIIDILKQKLHDNDFELYLQPILTVQDWRFMGAEALMRINDTHLGDLCPSEFIPIAEETGLIIDITYQILEKTCVIVKNMMDKGVDFYGISVNFPNIQFSEDNLAEKVIAIIEKHGIPFCKIKIEVTESMLSAKTEDITIFAEAVKEKEILLYLDDFGTGYSNLNSVINTPMDILKLDKSLLWSAMGSKRTAGSIKNLTWTFQEMGLRVLVEGVETIAQSQFVVDCGCTFIQGYLYAKPMPVCEAEKIMGTNPGGQLFKGQEGGY